ncbi:MAG: PhzF family phenazine biosynthesis protein [Bacteroidales bacterium]|jgi:PhzF family phenazine biosynthesis protein|nr:PhzF family phenazine biosynthesis protein [Bacteroidales bacterium]MDD2832198.1 PhzF family phenazine biosynthesis protein [Bacteroidales bacterium]MDD4474000.1 PhzF family phenazine biosynthesis protein [Bacteroidales bacterium]MDD5046977.1 PhzF family phenazine biosynthesis protein [Bacteroidales bacterium]MDD5517530.1 PhzF family phenazine biosynthesis protein [Bacteroidales bacterium]
MNKKMTDNKTIYQVDAFTDEPFKGNPAGVMIVDERTPAGWMQNIASEMNLSETAFIIPKGSGFTIRYFTPAKEVPLCGHATLAGSHIIYELGLKKAHKTIAFSAAGGELTIRKDKDWIIMDFPQYPIKKMDIPGDFKECVGFEPVEMYESIYNWKIAIAGSEAEIANVLPDFESMKKKELGELMITAESDSKQADFVVRCFAPDSGINEDPVTGSAHCALTPLWCAKLGKAEMDSAQISKRTGRLKVKLNNDRVQIKGKAVTIFEARLKI